MDLSFMLGFFVTSFVVPFLSTSATILVVAHSIPNTHKCVRYECRSPQKNRRQRLFDEQQKTLPDSSDNVSMVVFFVKI